MKFKKHILLLTGILIHLLSFSQADNCSFATTLSVTANCSSPVSGTSAGATASISGCAGNADDDVWYKFVATATSHQLTVTPSATYDPVVQLFSGACSSLTTIACQDIGGNGTAETIYTTGLTIGATYTFRVYHYGAGSGSSTFTVCVTTPPPAPSNNNCGGAISLSINTACSYTAGTSAGATLSAPGCAGTADDDVWFSFVATNSVQTITVDPSSSMDPVVQLFSGTCASMTSLYCMDNGFTNGNEVINAVGLTAGSTYYIRVYDYYNATGGAAFNICITGTATAVPTNDEPCSAIALPAVTSACNYLNFTTTGATASTATAPAPASCGGSSPFIGGFSATSKDVWFSITVPATGNLYITPQPGYGINDGVMALYSGACGSLTQISCSDDYNYPGSANDFKPYIAATGLTPGATVYLRYWGYGSTSGNFGLCVSSPTNDACANALYICDINGYSASTSAAYTPDRPCNMFGNNETAAGVDQPDGTNTGGIFGQGGAWGTGAPFFDVNINNNSWIRFTASATTASLNVTIGNCWVGNYPSGGIQMQIFSGTNCCSFVPVSDFRENSTGFTITANGLTVGQSYYLMVDGFAGDICNYTITANSGVSFPAITSSATSICYSSTGSNTVTLTAPTGATSYLWTPGGQTTQVITVAPSTTTTYTCVVEGVCGYKQTLTTTVNVNPLPGTLINSGSPVSVCNTQSVTLSATGASTYSWSTGAATSSISVSPSSNTSYTVTGTNTSTGCTSTATVAVTVLAQPSITVNSPTVCNGQTATLTSNGAAGTTNYTWSNGTNGTNTINVSPSGTTSYTVTGTAANGCTNTAVASVTVNPTPTITVNSPVICNGQSATLTSGGAATSSSYSWSTGTINTNTVSVSPASTTSYTVTGTAANSCTNTAVATVTVNPLPAITVNSPSICSGQAATLTSGGAATVTSYSWSTGTSGTNTISVSPTSNTSYTVTGTGSNSCTNTAVATVTVNSLPTITVNSATICSGQAATLTSAGGANTSSYSWSTGTSGTNTISVSPGSATSYTVTGTDANGCTNAAISTVLVNSLPTFGIIGSPPICNGQTATIAASGMGISGYVWSTGSTANGISVSPSSTTSYTVTATGTNGCTNSQVTSVTVNPSPSITVNSGAICEGQSIILTASGGNTYSWNTGASGPSISMNPASNTSYTVTGTDGNNCSNTAVSTVTVNVVPTITTTPTSAPSDCGLSNGALTGAVAAGSGTLSYSWTNSSNVVVGTSADLTNQPAGVYNLTVTSSNGCSSVFGPYNITNPGAPSAPSVIANDTSVCVGEMINLNASSTAPSPTFNWTGPNSSGTTSNLNISSSTLLDDGVYTVTVTSSGCTSPPFSINISVNPLPLANAGSSATTYCSDSTVSLFASGGTSYAWSGPNSFTSATQNPGLSPATVLMTGTYTVTVTDMNGCIATSTTYLTINQSPSTPIVSANASNYCEGDSILFSANSTGATAYSWSGPNGFTSALQNPDIINSSILQSGTYSVIASGNGCFSAMANVNVTVNVNPVATANVGTAIVCEGTAISLSSTGGGSYSWSGPNSFISTNQNPVINSATINDSGTFTVIVSNPAGCADTANVSVLVNPTPALPVVTANATDLCEGQDLLLTSSSGGAVNYSWTGPNGFISADQNPALLNTTVLESGTYSVIATAGACNSSAASITITVYANPVATASVNSTTLCSGDTISLNATSGGTYAWSGPGGFTSGAQNPVISNSLTGNSGIYTVIVSNPAGCADTATVSILVNQTPSSPIVSGDTTCVGDSLLLTANGTGTINWYSDALLSTLVLADSLSYSPVVPANTTATYYVTSVENGCTSVVSTVNAYNYTVIASATANPYSGFAPLNVTFSNLSSGVDASDLYSWNIGTSTFANTYNSFYSFTIDGNYVVTLIVTDIESGCTDTTMMDIFVDGEISYTIPNIFTPNEDQTNDEFTIISHGIKEINVVIYDRWGLKMYEFEGVHGRWDGRTTSGVRVTDGTYYYLFNAVDVNGKEYRENGHVMIMR